MKLTVGLPFYNNEDTLADAIRSVFAQKFEDWELILMDDGSRDGSLAVARAVADGRVRVFSDGHNRGLSARLNQMARQAGGEYLARMDADDLMHPERLARQVEFLDAHPEKEFVGCAIYSLDRGNRPRGKRGIGQPDLTPAGVLKRCPFIHPTILGRTEWFRCNPYDECYRRSEDHELAVRLVRASRADSFAQLADTLYFCREELSVRLDKYLGSCRDDRSLFRRYGPGMVGTAHTARLCLASWLKGEIYRASTRAGIENLLVRRRNAGLTAPEYQAAVKAIEYVTSTRVPGLAPADSAVGVAY